MCCLPHSATILCVLAEAILNNGETSSGRDYLDQTLAINAKMPTTLYYRGLKLELAGGRPT